MTESFLNSVNATFDGDGLKLISKFLLIFARFEYALKAAGFFKKGTSRAEPDWEAFVTTISPHFDPKSTVPLDTAVNYIIQDPPQVQRVINGRIVWAVRNVSVGQSQISKLKLHICDIRNNLFHGGKFNGTFEPEISRNYILLNHSLVILNSWLELDPKVQYHFLEPIQ